MKTQRRHELQTNALADWIGKWIEKLRPHSQTIGMGVVGVVVVVIAIGMVTNWWSSSQEAGWTEYLTAFQANEPNSDDLQQIASNNSGTPVGDWALLSAAELWLSQGQTKLYQNRDDAEKTLLKAKETLEPWLNGDKLTDPAMKQRGHFALGQVFESLAAVGDTNANLESARKEYKAIVDENSDSLLAKRAQEALTRLDDPNTSTILKAFAKYKPKLPDRPELSLPGEDGLGLDFGKLGLDDDKTSLPALPAMPSFPGTDAFPGGDVPLPSASDPPNKKEEK